MRALLFPQEAREASEPGKTYNALTRGLWTAQINFVDTIRGYELHIKYLGIIDSLMKTFVTFAVLDQILFPQNATLVSE